MSAGGKKRGTASGQPESPQQLLRAVWRSLPEEARDYWRDQFASSRKLADLRAELLATFKIRLGSDSQLARFRDWVQDQDQRDAQAARAQENETRVWAAHPHWTLDQVRDEVLKQSYFETLATGDFKLGLRTVAQDLGVKRVSLEQDKVKQATKAEQAKALEFCLAEAREFPAVREMFLRAFAALRQATNRDPETPAALPHRTPSPASSAPDPESEPAPVAGAPQP